MLPREKTRTTKLSEIFETDDPGYIDALRATSDACDEMFELACALINIDPTTIAGVAALSKYVAACGENDDWMFPEYTTLGADDDGDDGEPYRVAAPCAMSARSSRE
jgi:hypothetical protein